MPPLIYRQPRHETGTIFISVLKCILIAYPFTVISDLLITVNGYHSRPLGGAASAQSFKASYWRFLRPFKVFLRPIGMGWTISRFCASVEPISGRLVAQWAPLPLFDSKKYRWMTGWMNEWMKELMYGWMNERMKDWMDRWMYGWMNEWMNEWQNE